MWKLAGRIVFLTLALPFLILAMPVLAVRALIRYDRTHRNAMDDEARLNQRIHEVRIRMDRGIESAESTLLRESISV